MTRDGMEVGGVSGDGAGIGGDEERAVGAWGEAGVALGLGLVLMV